MKGTNYEGSGSAEEEGETLPGLGPQLGIESLHRQEEHAREMRLSTQEREVLGLMQGQIERYEWFAQRVEPERSIDEIAAALLRAPEGPGAWEAALVALSLREDVMAQALLAQWEPPAGDAELGLFYQICRTRSRQRCEVSQG